MNSQIVTPSGGIVPSPIAHRSQGCELVVAVADNWDHNERTVDGKQSTHAMTSLLMSNKTADFPVPRLTKSDSRTFNANSLPGGGLCSIISYRKPAKRPSPKFLPPVTIDELLDHPIPSAVRIARAKELLYSIGRTALFCDDLAEERIPLLPN
ncbi:hypothetical protein DPMN_152832 [Dreissena polymorpha]|uniref:Uncharacterized protein n=1 Tax=Dreissena polymorpha TaxID=45954 RepID=A0A9D4FM02_DREPO|nr:hypothetical protein DPMN_152832 [Dreissena polymorpha]